MSVRPREVHDRQRRQLAIVVMGVVVAICFLAGGLRVGMSEYAQPVYLRPAPLGDQPANP